MINCDENVLEIIVDKLFLDIKSWFGTDECSGADEQDIKDELYEVLSNNADWDGYILARNLDIDFNWEPDENLINILAKAKTFVKSIKEMENGN